MKKIELTFENYKQGKFYLNGFQPYIEVIKGKHSGIKELTGILTDSELIKINNYNKERFFIQPIAKKVDEFIERFEKHLHTCYDPPHFINEEIRVVTDCIRGDSQIFKDVWGISYRMQGNLPGGIAVATMERVKLSPAINISGSELNDIRVYLKEYKQFIDKPSYFITDGRVNVYAEALIKYLEYLRNLLSSELNSNQELIIKPEYIGLIFNKYETLFTKETKDQWLIRFRYPNTKPVDKMPLNSKEAREDTDRLTLIAILAAIQERTGNSFDYNDFVLKRFGLTNFEQAKNKHKKKNTYTKVLTDCRKILRIDTF